LEPDKLRTIKHVDIKIEEKTNEPKKTYESRIGINERIKNNPTERDQVSDKPRPEK